MSAQPFYALTPTTPPPSTEFDKAAIYTGLDYYYPSSSTSGVYPYPRHQVSHTSTLPPSILPPTPPEGRVKKQRTGLDMGDIGMKKGKMDMNMAVRGSVAAQPGIQTPLAQYTGKPPSSLQSTSFPLFVHFG
jgi:hypothetical protein